MSTTTNSLRTLTTVWVSHFPYVGDSPPGGGDRYDGWRPADDGRWLLHGHVHERWRQRGRMVNVGVDAWGFRPASGAEILSLISAGHADRGPLRAEKMLAGR